VQDSMQTAAKWLTIKEAAPYIGMSVAFLRKAVRCRSRGAAKSKRKAASSRENGKLGGRPRKKSQKEKL